MDDRRTDRSAVCCTLSWCCFRWQEGDVVELYWTIRTYGRLWSPMEDRWKIDGFIDSLGGGSTRRDGESDATVGGLAQRHSRGLLSCLLLTGWTGRRVGLGTSLGRVWIIIRFVAVAVAVAVLLARLVLDFRIFPPPPIRQNQILEGEKGEGEKGEKTRENGEISPSSIPPSWRTIDSRRTIHIDEIP